MRSLESAFNVLLILFIAYQITPAATVLEDGQTTIDGSAAHGPCYPSTSQTLEVPNTISSPSQPPKNWWCSLKDEYSWLGFSYGVTHCPSRAEMVKSFRWMRTAKKARYVRLYGGCDRDGFDNDVIEAAASAAVGIYALIWFGFDGDDKWKGRKARLLKAIRGNPKAPYVIRAVTCGSEPLYDGVLPVDDLVRQIEDLKKQLGGYGILTTLSEMPAGYQAKNDTPRIFQAVDFVSLHSFGFFDQNATTAVHAQPIIRADVLYGLRHGAGKKVVITQTGWPSNTKAWKPNSPKAVADLTQEREYFEMLDRQCGFFKSKKISWFSHVYNETSVPGWGILYANGTEKIPFTPRISC